MDEYLNSRQKEIFHNLLANPADTGSAYANSLQEMVKSYPQVGLLRALYGRALNDKQPAAAGAYFDSRALFKLYHQPDSLLAVDDSRIILQPESRLVKVPDEPGEDQSLDFHKVPHVSWMTDQDEARPYIAPWGDTDKHHEPTKPAEIPAEEEIIAEAATEAPVFTEPETAPVVDEQAETLPAEAKTETDIEDDVFDEITGIDDIEIVQNPAGNPEKPVITETVLPEHEGETPPTAAETQPITDEAEKLILGNIAATDYFVFDKAFGDNRKPAPAAAEPVTAPDPTPEEPAFVAAPQETAPVSEPAAEENTHHDVSKYHDEKMPYTFMWWLDKTRKEHGNLYQPYTKAPVSSPVGLAKRPVNDALQQQYFENIFHLTSVDELGKDAASQTIEFDMQSKGDRIIQRFIAEDPQIHPPVGEKLDTENKARKSSEDNNEMVTETLARIYADQMLYPKAIDTYKKLMLKFPEKSRYFASRIENLEKKTN